MAWTRPVQNSVSNSHGIVSSLTIEDNEHGVCARRLTLCIEAAIETWKVDMVNLCDMAAKARLLVAVHHRAVHGIPYFPTTRPCVLDSMGMG
jgi:hypothetical protein